MRFLECLADLLEEENVCSRVAKAVGRLGTAAAETRCRCDVLTRHFVRNHRSLGNGSAWLT